jgi:glycosyltransferase involved in cell wall biosynthesis
MKKDKIKQDYGRYIFAAGRLTKQKNFSFLIDCFYEISTKYKSLNLVIAGSGEQENYLMSLVKKYELEGRVFLIGHQDNVYNFFYNCQCFVMPSLWEDPGFVLIEAAFCRANIISSDCLSGPRDFFDNKRFGYVFDLNDKDQFLKLFDTVLNDSELKNKKNKKILVKRTRDYSIFRHFQKLNNLLSL